MDPDYIAFRALLRQAETDPALAAELTRAMVEARPLREILALAPAVSSDAEAMRTISKSSPAPGSGDGDQ